MLVSMTTSMLRPDASQLPDFARAGHVLPVACERRVLDFRVAEEPDATGAFSAYAPRLQVREGLRIGTRVFADGSVYAIDHRIASAIPVTTGEALVQLELVRVEALGEERRAPRAAYNALATVRSAYYAAYDLAPFRVNVVEVSRIGLAFECERQFKPGLSWDVTFEDESGSAITGRIDTVRVQTGRFGRNRVLTRFVAIDAADRLLIDRLVDRIEAQASRPASAAAPQESFGDLREQLLAAPKERRGLRFLRRR
jgi:hypothetical protein